MKKTKIQIIVGSVLVCLVIATLYFAIKSTAEGGTLISLTDKEADLVGQNQELQAQIVSASSLSQISKTAQSLGMIVPEKYIYMGNQGVAMR